MFTFYSTRVERDLIKHSRHSADTIKRLYFENKANTALNSRPLENHTKSLKHTLIGTSWVNCLPEQNSTLYLKNDQI